MMKKNSKSIYGCGLSGIPKPDYGRITRKGNFVYYHVTEPLIGYVPLTGIDRAKIKKVRLLQDGSEMEIQNNWITGNYPDIAFVTFGASPKLPDPIDTVIEVELYE